MQNLFFLKVGSLSGLFAVLLGAFAAHGLEHWMAAPMLQRFRTGVDYQFYHTFALLLVAALHTVMRSPYLHYAGYAFIIGIVLFSGSLYAYALTGAKFLVLLTPLGGLSFAAGWLFLFFITKNDAYTRKI